MKTSKFVNGIILALLIFFSLLNPDLRSYAVNIASSKAQKVVSNPDDYLALINKFNILKQNYVPQDLVLPRVKGNRAKILMRKNASVALEALFNQAKEQGITLYAVSGYRSFNTQKDLFRTKTNRLKSVELANLTSAKAGESEHQTGLAMDVSCSSLNYALLQSFEVKKEGKWLKQNCADFGYIIRYPKGKEKVTGYAFEPWHIRYVGIENSQKIMKNGFTLEEFLIKPQGQKSLEEG